MMEKIRGAPDMTVAVHWLVDDTAWEVQDPVASVGTILRDQNEARVIRDVVAAVVLVSNRQGPTASDAHWLRDEGWSEVRRAAGNAAAALGKGEHIERLAAGTVVLTSAKAQNGRTAVPLRTTSLTLRSSPTVSARQSLTAADECARAGRSSSGGRRP